MKEIRDDVIFISFFFVVSARLSQSYSFNRLIRNRRSLTVWIGFITRNVLTEEISTASVDGSGVYVARDGPSISLKKISRLSVRNGNGILFPRIGGSFRQLADRYLADWIDSTRLAAEIELTGPVIDREFISV